jgi:dCTP deaminase
VILSAQSIRRRVGMIEPFHERTVHRGMSYGLSHAGYDIRVLQTIVLRPGGFALASSIERFSIPSDLCAMVKDKSTWARRGLALQNTIAEPGWSGFLTLELSNHSDQTIQILTGDPIAQMVFMRLDEPTESPYAGKYQGQPNKPVPAVMETL